MSNKLGEKNISLLKLENLSFKQYHVFVHFWQIEGYGDTAAGYTSYLETALDPDVNAVAVGFDPYINYVKVVKAASYLMKPECIYVGSNMDSYFPSKGDIRLPGM